MGWGFRMGFCRPDGAASFRHPLYTKTGTDRCTENWCVGACSRCDILQILESLDGELWRGIWK